MKPQITDEAPIILDSTELNPNGSIRKVMMAERHTADPFMIVNIKKVYMKFLFSHNAHNSSNIVNLRFLKLLAVCYALFDGKVLGLER